MAPEDSRKIPTYQELPVGKFLLAQVTEKSDKSAMANVDEIRRKLKETLKARSIGAVALATKLGLNRNYISDFLAKKKRSLGAAETAVIAEALGIPVRDITPELEKVDAIRKGARPHLYITEHMEHRGLDDEAVSGRIDGIDPPAIARWRAHPSKMQDWQVAAILHALNMDDVADLSHLPAPPAKPEVPTRRKIRRTG